MQNNIYASEYFVLSYISPNSGIFNLKTTEMFFLFSFWNPDLEFYLLESKVLLMYNYIFLFMSPYCFVRLCNNSSWPCTKTSDKLELAWLKLKSVLDFNHLKFSLMLIFTLFLFLLETLFLKLFYKEFLQECQKCVCVVVVFFFFTPKVSLFFCFLPVPLLSLKSLLAPATLWASLWVSVCLISEWIETHHFLTWGDLVKTTRHQKGASNMK